MAEFILYFLFLALGFFVGGYYGSKCTREKITKELEQIGIIRVSRWEAK